MAASRCWGCLAALACAAGCFEAASSRRSGCRVRADSGPPSESPFSGASAIRPFGALARSRRLAARVARVGGTKDDGAGGRLKSLQRRC